jgi:hypothetical protein
VGGISPAAPHHPKHRPVDLHCPAAPGALPRLAERAARAGIGPRLSEVQTALRRPERAHRGAPPAPRRPALGDAVRLRRRSGHPIRSRALRRPQGPERPSVPFRLRRNLTQNLIPFFDENSPEARKAEWCACSPSGSRGSRRCGAEGSFACGANRSRRRRTQHRGRGRDKDAQPLRRQRRLLPAANGSSLVFGHPQGRRGARLIAVFIEVCRCRGAGVGLFAGCAPEIPERR